MQIAFATHVTYPIITTLPITPWENDLLHFIFALKQYEHSLIYKISNSMLQFYKLKQSQILHLN